MLRSYRGIIVAFGIAFATSAASQQSANSVVEVKPVASARNDNGGASAKSQLDRKQETSRDPTAALAGIESAIRDLVTKEDAAERKQKKDNERRDLNAQETMAHWSEWMFWTAAASVVLTFIALITIIETLKYTRQAANYSGNMLDEAKKATSAAEATHKTTREIGIKQVRANISYFRHEVADITNLPGTEDTEITLYFKNFGQSPARDVCFDVMYQSELVWPEKPEAHGMFPPPTFRAFSYSSVKGSTLKFCGPGSEVVSHRLKFSRTKIISKFEKKPPIFYYIAGYVRYKDDFWQNSDDYRFCKFCFIVRYRGPDDLSLPLAASNISVSLQEHGPDNYAD